MNVRELIEILKDFPEETEVIMSIVAPVEGDEISTDLFTIDGVLPWPDEESGEEVLWLVGGEEDDVEAMLDALEDEDEEE